MTTVVDTVAKLPFNWKPVTDRGEILRVTNRHTIRRTLLATHKATGETVTMRRHVMGMRSWITLSFGGKLSVRRIHSERARSGWNDAVTVLRQVADVVGEK